MTLFKAFLASAATCTIFLFSSDDVVCAFHAPIPSVSEGVVSNRHSLFSAPNDSSKCPVSASRHRSDTRRKFFQGLAFTTAVASSIPPHLKKFYVAVATSNIDYKAVSADIADIIAKDPDKGPTFVRLSWHASGTYDKMSNSGGSQQGTIRFRKELEHAGNAGLANTAVPWLEPVYEKYADSGLSYADLYTLGGATAIKEMGGPTVTWGSGRVDSMNPLDVLGDGRLPNADSGPPGADKSDADHLRKIFYRMGFNDQEIVALSGAHALGRCHTDASGYDGPWTPTPTTFNNVYFTLLESLPWSKREWNGPFQYENGKGGKLMMLPTDLVLLQDKSFKKYVDLYAKDGKKFERDFSDAFAKLLGLGTKDLSPTAWV